MLFNGKPWDPDDKEVELPDRIFVFDWNGIPQKIYTLDQGIINFAVDKVQKRYMELAVHQNFMWWNFHINNR